MKYETGDWYIHLVIDTTNFCSIEIVRFGAMPPKKICIIGANKNVLNKY